MNAYRLRLFRFTRTAYTMNLTVTAEAEKLAAILRKAQRHETLKHTAGLPSVFSWN